jgi:hypothetical protein
MEGSYHPLFKSSILEYIAENYSAPLEAIDEMPDS